MIYFTVNGLVFPLFAEDNSSETLLLPGEENIYPVTDHLFVLKDSNQKFTLEDILSPEIQYQFEKSKFNPPVLPGSEDAVWFRLRLNEKSPEKNKYFYLDFYLIHDITIFIPDRTGNYRSFRGGRSLPESKQIVPGKHIIFPADFREGPSDIYIRVYQPEEVLHLNLYLVDFTGLTQIITDHTQRISLYIAVISAFFIYNVIIFFIIREKAYLFYSLHILFIGSTFAGIYGLLHGLTELTGIPSMNRLTEILAQMAGIFSVLFTVDFLGMKKRSMLLARFTNFLILILILNSILTAFGWKYSQTVWFVTLLTGAFTLLFFALRYSFRDPFCAIYSVSWGFHLTILSLAVLPSLGIYETHLRTNHIMMGSAFELFILSSAIGYKFTKIINEKREIEIKMSQGLKREDSLKKLSYRDPLTEIYNRRKFEESIESIIEEAEKGKKIFSLIFIDIDHFKSINDRYGHDTGDQVLVNFTVTVTGLIRKSDIFCRFGGEEFAIIVENAGINDAENLAEKIRSTVEKVIYIENKDYITVSCGVTQYIKGDSLRTILKRADNALYEAKDSGRNRVVKHSSMD